MYQDDKIWNKQLSISSDSLTLSFFEFNFKGSLRTIDDKAQSTRYRQQCCNKEWKWTDNKDKDFSDLEYGSKTQCFLREVYLEKNLPGYDMYIFLKAIVRT